MKKPQSKSARIRKMLEQGKSVKQIVAAVGCTAQMVYLTRSNMKKKEKKPIVIPRGVWQELPQKATIDDIVKTMQPVSKPNVFKRIANWFFGG